MREKLIGVIKDVSNFFGIDYIILFNILIIILALFYLARLRNWKTMEDSEKTFSIVMVSASIFALVILN